MICIELRIHRKITFSIHRKATTTDRYITFDSFCSHQHKLAAFNSMVYRMIRVPLSTQDFMTEYNRIIDIADKNGFQKSLIDRLVKKHTHRAKRENSSTLFTQNHTITQSNTRRIAMNFTPEITNRLSDTFKRSGLQIVHTNTHKLRTSFGSTKDKKPMERKSGIYEITCPVCHRKYIGQTRRAVHCRIKEHERYIKQKDIHKAVAAHTFDLDNESPHFFDPILENYKLIKTVNQPYKLDAYESLYISNGENLINIDASPIESNLFTLAK